MLPAIVEIKTKTGQSFIERVDYVYGHPSNPMSWEDIIDKFKDCVSYAASPIPDDNVTRAVDKIRNLETVSNMEEVFLLLN